MNENTPRDPGATGSAREKVRDTASNLAGTAKEQASRAASKVMDKAEEQFNTKRQTVVGELESFTSVMRDAGNRLREQNGSAIGATVVSTIADKLDEFGRSVQGKDLNTIFGDVETFARHNPAAFLGTAAALGFLASRFMKSSRRSNPLDAWSANDFRSAGFATGSTGDISSKTMNRTGSGSEDL
jgi:ElaB/YqjD/DUF883 family membrane-anchored ribosome-binding protein